MFTADFVPEVVKNGLFAALCLIRKNTILERNPLLRCYFYSGNDIKKDLWFCAVSGDFAKFLVFQSLLLVLLNYEQIYS